MKKVQILQDLKEPLLDLRQVELRQVELRLVELRQGLQLQLQQLEE
jgi:hypothetical protein